MGPWSRAEILARFIIAVSAIGAVATLLMDMLANAAEAPAMLRDCLRCGSAGVFALAGVCLWHNRQHNP